MVKTLPMKKITPPVTATERAEKFLSKLFVNNPN